MKQNQLIFKTLVVVTLLLGSINTANAQFGGLKKLAKKAVKDKVDPGSATSSATADGMDVAPKGWRYHGGKVHRFVPSERSEVLKFLECNQTPDMETVYSYYDLPSNETINAPAKSDYSDVAGDLIRLLWDLHDVEGSLGGKNPEGWIRTIDKEMADKINHAAAYGTEPAEVADKFDAELLRVKALFHDKYFPNEAKLVGADNSAWLSQREASRVEFKYGLNELKDNGSNPKMKQQFEAAVKSKFQPTKILATYIVSSFWRGMPCRQMPEYGEDWRSVQEKPMKSYYMKGGKYYYVKGGFRQGCKNDDPSGSMKPLADYNPGLQEPIEIPASIAKKYFK